MVLRTPSIIQKVCPVELYVTQLVFTRDSNKCTQLKLPSTELDKLSLFDCHIDKTNVMTVQVGLKWLTY
jgi:hypothetical protein